MSYDLLKIGTSGIVLPGNKATFPENFKNASRLQYYSSLFDSLEINSSFYKIPLPATFTKWAAEVPDNFKFTVKLWRDITHAKNLIYSQDDITRFMQAANNLGTKAGCLLIQFPASITSKFDQQVQSILHAIQNLNSKRQWQVAIEFRHTTWYHQAIYDLLDHYDTSLVIHDMPKSQTPSEYQPKHLAYLRFHGPTGKYNGSYSEEFITEQAKKIMHWRKQGKAIYVYFNNTMGNALQNAQFLQKLT